MRISMKIIVQACGVKAVAIKSVSAWPETRDEIGKMMKVSRGVFRYQDVRVRGSI